GSLRARQPAACRAGGGPAGRHRRERGTPAARIRAARRDRERAAGDAVPRDPAVGHLLRAALVRGAKGGRVSAGGSVLLGVVGGAIRISTPFLFVSLGECLTEKSGRVNLGLEGTLVMGAMSAYGVSYLTGSPWLGVLTAGAAGVVLGALHAWLCARPRVNDVAVGIALMLFGVGLAFFLGKPLIGPTAPHPA